MTEDERLEHGFAVMAPRAEQVQRIERGLEPIIDAPVQSLVSEWLDLLRIRPLLHGGMTFLTAGLLGVLSPLGQLVLWIVRTASP